MSNSGKVFSASGSLLAGCSSFLGVLACTLLSVSLPGLFPFLFLNTRCRSHSSVKNPEPHIKALVPEKTSLITENADAAFLTFIAAGELYKSFALNDNPSKIAGLATVSATVGTANVSIKST
eukprot:NODE_190_length_15503_cov_0.365814.p12 type:complete len:122 gc:universal NODE_190_length_15503_cov_0.365814:8369-8734(+)